MTTPIDKASRETAVRISSRLSKRILPADMNMMEGEAQSGKADLVEALGHCLWLIEVEHKIDGQHITRDAHKALLRHTPPQGEESKT